MKKSKVKKVILIIIALLGYGAVAFVAGYQVCIYKNKQSVEISEKGEGLKLPGEEAKKYITKDEITSRIIELEELVVQSSEYTVSRAVNDPRNIYGYDVPFTTNRIQIDCKGIVKVGYDLTQMQVETDEDTISIVIPSARVLDNYIMWDTVVCKEKNNIFHPIEHSQYEELIKKIETEGLADAESKGIYSKTDERLEKLIIERLQDIDDRGVKITFKD